MYIFKHPILLVWWIVSTTMLPTLNVVCELLFGLRHGVYTVVRFGRTVDLLLYFIVAQFSGIYATVYKLR